MVAKKTRVEHELAVLFGESTLNKIPNFLYEILQNRQNSRFLVLISYFTNDDC